MKNNYNNENSRDKEEEEKIKNQGFKDYSRYSIPHKHLFLKKRKKKS